MEPVGRRDGPRRETVFRILGAMARHGYAALQN